MEVEDSNRPLWTRLLKSQSVVVLFLACMVGATPTLQWAPLLPTGNVCIQGKEVDSNGMKEERTVERKEQERDAMWVQKKNCRSKW